MTSRNIYITPCPRRPTATGSTCLASRTATRLGKKCHTVTVKLYITRGLVSYLLMASLSCLHASPKSKHNTAIISYLINRNSTLPLVTSINITFMLPSTTTLLNMQTPFPLRRPTKLQKRTTPRYDRLYQQAGTLSSYMNRRIFMRKPSSSLTGLCSRLFTCPNTKNPK